MALTKNGRDPSVNMFLRQVRQEACKSIQLQSLSLPSEQISSNKCGKLLMAMKKSLQGVYLYASFIMVVLGARLMDHAVPLKQVRAIDQVETHNDIFAFVLEAKSSLKLQSES